MGRRLTIDSVLKGSVTQDISWNINSDLAFDNHIGNKNVLHEYAKTSLISDAFVLYRYLNDLEPDQFSLSEFSILMNEEFINKFVEWATDNFVDSYKAQDGYFDLDDDEVADWIDDLNLFIETIEEVNFDTHHLIITYM